MRSTSQQVKAANSKLAQFLRSQEEEEALLIYKRPKRRASGDPTRLSSRNRWTLDPDFSIPSGLVDRPRTASGGTTFHFSWEPISKTIVPTHADGRVIGWAFSRQHTTPLHHARYIEREGAAEATPASQNAGYIERPGAIETYAGDGAVAPTSVPTGEVLAIYSNISDDPELRDLFWREVPGQENEIRSCNLELNFDRSPEWWCNLPFQHEIDRGFRDHALREADNKQKDPDHEVEPFKCPPARGIEILRQITEVGGFDENSPPIAFTVRGGRIQYRIVIELPHELTPKGRFKIMRRTCDHLGSLELCADENRLPKRVGMVFTGVIHAPDNHNDSRNFHLHIVAHDRPAKLIIDEHGPRWVFDPKKLEATRDINFPKRLRGVLANIVNEQMSAEGKTRRYDARTYEEMEIIRRPTKHLGKDAHALDSVGIYNPTGASNGVSIWKDAEDSLAAEIERVRARRKQQVEPFLWRLRRANGYQPDRDDTEEGWQAYGARLALIDGMADDHRELLLLQQREDKAKSRAVRTIRTCRNFLAGIAAGEADRFTVRNEENIRARLATAEEWVLGINAALEADREAIREATANVLKHDEMLAALDAELVQFGDSIVDAAKHERPPVAMSSSLREMLGNVTNATAATAVPHSAEAQQKVSSEPLYSGPPTMEGRPISEAARPAEPADGIEQQPDWSEPLPLGGDDHKKAVSAEEVVLEATVPGTVVDAATEPALTPPLPEAVPAQEAVVAISGDAESATETPRSQRSHDRRSGPAKIHGEGSTEELRAADEGNRAGAVPASPTATPAPFTEKESGADPAAAPALGKRSDGDECNIELTRHDEPLQGSEAQPVDRESTAEDRADPGSAMTPSASMGADPAPTPSVAEPSSTDARHESPSDQRRLAAERRVAKDRTAALKAWDAAFNHIQKQHLPIIRKGGGYDVVGLPREHRLAMLHPSLKKRTRDRIASYFKVQEMEMSRVIIWLEKHGADDQQLAIVNGVATPTASAPRAMQSLIRKHLKQQRIIDFVGWESERRALEQAAIEKAFFDRLQKGR